MPSRNGMVTWELAASRGNGLKVAPGEAPGREDLALTLNGGVIIAVDDSGFGFLKLPSY
ncbi:MAG: hypothetical protein VX633_07690 [Verrucomicrobiota bacterium]|nr:hypothetical protein [Verrucomicrobiota bacterium]